jgi:hypothetical protein
MKEQRREAKIVHDDRVEELIRHKFRNCATGSLFEASRRAVSEWFSQPTTGRQLHLLEVRQAKG